MMLIAPPAPHRPTCRSCVARPHLAVDGAAPPAAKKDGEAKLRIIDNGTSVSVVGLRAAAVKDVPQLDKLMAAASKVVRFHHALIACSV